MTRAQTILAVHNLARFIFCRQGAEFLPYADACFPVYRANDRWGVFAHVGQNDNGFSESAA